ncbi:Threonine--tRNA ligase [Dissostichus eleginoides]|uniref:Threonine--tRNA ligase n=1 Tax=Dissostichus eleginoides TaxID=100907 RepID=A0AAD9ES08_DISEL|nr:Threonine--tRNA ligase [Dissostichus eleginoides]
MDRRSPQNNRGNPRPFDHGAEADRAYRQVHCRNGQINGLDEYRGAFQEERTRFCHSMRKQKDKVKRLEELLSYRDSGYQQENKRLVDTIMEREAEISRLNENIEDAERQHKRQMDQIVARHEAEKGNVSDEKDQVTLTARTMMFPCSVTQRSSNEDEERGDHERADKKRGRTP